MPCSVFCKLLRNGAENWYYAVFFMFLVQMSSAAQVNIHLSSLTCINFTPGMSFALIIEFLLYVLDFC